MAFKRFNTLHILMFLDSSKKDIMSRKCHRRTTNFILIFSIQNKGFRTFHSNVPKNIQYLYSTYNLERDALRLINQGYM